MKRPKPKVAKVKKCKAPKKPKKQKVYSPSTREASPPPQGFLAKAKKIISQLELDNKFGDFRNPVLWEEWGLIDYPKIVQKPMDLSTIRQNLDSLVYENAVTFR